mgnify:CR=1 FL=1
MKTNRDKDINGYSLSRQWFDFCFENPEKIRPNHTALYFFIIEHCNRLGWKDKFGLPTTVTMEAIGIKSYNTYKKTLEELISFGFVEMIEKSKNQYSANIIALSNFDKALDKALDKAVICSIKKSESTIQSTGESISSINKPINQEPLTGGKPTPIEKSDKEIEFERFNKWIDENARYIRKIKDQITFAEYDKITKLYNGDQIKKILTDLANFKDAPRKYVSVNLTFQKWAKKEFANG